MDIRLPDGTILRGVPDGTSKAEITAKLKTMGYDTSLLEDAPKGTGSVALDSGNAVGTGFQRGMLRLAGLPVDTVANVIDMGKAGLGSAYGAITGKAPPDALVPQDRAEVVGSGDYLINRGRKSKLGELLLDPVNPDYEGGYLQTAGGGAAGVFNPVSRAQAVNQILNNVVGAEAGKFVQDKTGNEALAIAASMSPNAAQNVVTGATKMAVRGGEKGRLEMEQRIADLKNAGVENPTLGLASGNRMIGGTENLLQNTPGAIDVMRAARDRAIAGIQSKTNAAAEAASPRRGALESGADIKAGIQQFRADYGTKQADLYNLLERTIGGNTPMTVGNTRNALSALNEDIPGAPNLSKFFKNGKIQAIQGALEADVSQSRAYSPTQLRAAAATNPQNAAAFDEALNASKLPFEAVKKTRTMVGREIADTNLLSEVPRSKWNPLYAALSEDMGAAAAKSGPDATRAFNRASDYTRAGAARLEKVAPFADALTPEKAFLSLMGTTPENGSTLQALKKTLPEGARGTIAGTVIERLGKALPGQQNEVGDVFSTERFLTNYNAMTPKARNELFSGFPNSARVRSDVDAVAKAASMMRENSKMWANPSGTGANSFARGVMIGAPATALLNPWAPVAIGGLFGANNMLARSLTSRGVVNSMAQRNNLSPQMTAAQIQGLLAGSLLEEDQRH